VDHVERLVDAEEQGSVHVRDRDVDAHGVGLANGDRVSVHDEPEVPQRPSPSLLSR